MKFINYVAICGVAGCLLGITPAFSNEATDQPDDLTDIMSDIMTWWDGDYNNDVQLQKLLANGKPVWRLDGSGEGGHIQVTSHYRSVDLPAFGDNVIYVEETKHGDPGNIFRQRIYTLAADRELNMVRVKLWNFKDKEKYVGAWKDLARLTELSPDDMSPLPDKCDLYAERQDGKIHMPMRGRDCAFGDRYFNYQVLLDADSFWFRDKIVRLSDDEIIQSAGDFSYHELDKLP